MRQFFVNVTRLGILVAAVFFAFGTVFARLFYLQVIEQDKLQKIAESSRQRLTKLYARRGNILDCRGNILATTHAVMELGVDPQVVREEDREKIPELSKLIGVPEAEIEAYFDEKVVSGENSKEVKLVRWRKLASAIEDELYEQIKELGIKGVYGNRKYIRIYPGDGLGAHVVGFMNQEEVPVMGVEQYMDFYLKGSHGWRKTENDGRRRELPQFRTQEVGAISGYNVGLSLDGMVQHIVEEEVEKIVEQYDPEGVSVIVSDAKTGFILALANYPSFDLNDYGKASMDTLRNRAISDLYEPASTFKIVPASAALNEGIVSLKDQFDCSHDKVIFEGREVRLPSDHKPFEFLSFPEVVQKSSNRGVAYMGMMLGADRLYDYARAFGFGEKLGYGPVGEVSGILHEVKDWDGLTISRLPMGHALGATPLQVHAAMSVIANDGVLMRPQVVRKVVDRDGLVVKEFEPKPIRKTLEKRTAQVMRKLLWSVVGPQGTSRRAAIDGYQVAGKSGTTQKIVNGRYSRSHHIASFSGFFPATDPEIVITVVVDDPILKGTGYGGVVAAPAFRSIAFQLIQYLAIPEPQRSSKEMLAYSSKTDHALNRSAAI